jgi:glyoxylase-like metal-dependent hydrolase (beta-lactamase superfamily II)
MEKREMEMDERPEVGDTQTTGENRVTPFNMGHYNIYFIETQRGYILVDAGMPNLGGKLDEALAQAGVDPQSVHLIIATHGHMDHIGSVAHAQRVTGAQVMCHRSFAENLANGVIEPATPRKLTGRLLNILSGFLGSKFEGIRPDIVVEDEFDLSEHGIQGKVIHTPGHSPSSISIVLGNGEALIGDNLRAGKSGEIGPGMFYEDLKLLRKGLERVASFEPRTIYLSHSDEIDNCTFKNAIAAL